MFSDFNDILVSIVMPIYNGETHLKQSLDSIVSQTHNNWELIIINEYGSNDNSLKIINEYAKYDGRFVIIQNHERLGISASMNVGIRAAKGKYIARMDADDISLPKRLEEQLRFMEEHEDIVMCGTRVKTFGSKSFRWIIESDPDIIDSNMLFYSPCVHPTIMIKTDFLKENNLGYDECLKATEDYDLFSRINEIGKVSNVDRKLFRYRMEGSNTTFRNNDVGLDYYKSVIGRQCNALDLSFDGEELDILSPHGILKKAKDNEAINLFVRLNHLLARILIANEKVKRYNRSCIMETLHRRFYEAYREVKHNCDIRKLYGIYRKSIFSTKNVEWKRCGKIGNPIITVILPVFSDTGNLLDTVWNFIGQTEERFELLIVSNDENTKTIIELFGDDRIRLVSEEVGQESFDRIIEEAQGRFIIQMDTDDVPSANRLRRQLSYLKSNDESSNVIMVDDAVRRSEEVSNIELMMGIVNEKWGALKVIISDSLHR